MTIKALNRPLRCDLIRNYGISNTCLYVFTVFACIYVLLSESKTLGLLLCNFAQMSVVKKIDVINERYDLMAELLISDGLV